MKFGFGAPAVKEMLAVRASPRYALDPCSSKPRQFLSAILLAMLAACTSVPTPRDGAAVAETVAQSVPLELLNPDVRQDTIAQTICVPGYTASIRPSTTYTNGVKLKLMHEKSIPPETTGSIELDHRIPLALGGHPRNLQNLTLQPWEGEDGAKKKDRLERALQKLVCASKVMLEDARRAIYVDWQAAYRTYVISRPLTVSP
ncbi:MAG: hypothetical protein H7255_20375 [Ramlibacter sp.]|nr:hypothetical protein [Ramlibacter sp.]